MKRYRKFCLKFIIINLFFTLGTIYVCLYFYKNILLNIEQINKPIDVLLRNSTDLNGKVNKIKHDFSLLEDDVKNNNILISDLRDNDYNNDIALINAKINNIINSKPEEEKLKFTIIKEFNTILKKYYNNQRFDENITGLKILCKNNEILLEYIKQLEEYSNINSKLMLETFDNEAKNIKIDNENSIFKNLIKIKKIADKKTVKSINTTIEEIKINIAGGNLKIASDLIIENNYQDKFVKTIELINENQKFLDLLDLIIKNI